MPWLLVEGAPAASTQCTLLLIPLLSFDLFQHLHNNPVHH